MNADQKSRTPYLLYGGSYPLDLKRTNQIPRLGYCSGLRFRSDPRKSAANSPLPKHKVQRTKHQELRSLKIKLCLRRLSVISQCSMLAYGIGPLEDPVLPGRQTAVNLRVHGFRSGKSE